MTAWSSTATVQVNEVLWTVSGFAGMGQPIPNFSDGYTGRAPDIGAHQRGAPPMRYGVAASQP